MNRGASRATRYQRSLTFQRKSLESRSWTPARPAVAAAMMSADRAGEKKPRPMMKSFFTRYPRAIKPQAMP
jgi:hypothetical protein